MPILALVLLAGADGSSVGLYRLGMMITSRSGCMRVLTAHSTANGSITSMSSSTTVTSLAPSGAASRARMMLRASAGWRLRIETTTWWRLAPPGVTLIALTSGVILATSEKASAVAAGSIIEWFSVIGMPVRVFWYMAPRRIVIAVTSRTGVGRAPL